MEYTLSRTSIEVRRTALHLLPCWKRDAQRQELADGRTRCAEGLIAAW